MKEEGQDDFVQNDEDEDAEVIEIQVYIYIFYLHNFGYFLIIYIYIICLFIYIGEVKGEEGEKQSNKEEKVIYLKYLSLW